MKTSINSDIRISKGFLDSLSDIIFVFDNQRNVLFANSVLYERLNYRSQDLIGKDISILYSPDQKYNIKEPIEKALQNEFVTINIPLISRKGHKINVNTKFFRKSWNGEKVILGVAQNPIIQAYTIFNKEDKNWKKFYKNVLNAIQDGINILDTNYENILVNSWMDKKYSFVPTLIGKKCYEVYQQRKSICPWCPCEKTFISGEMNTSVVPYPSSENPQGLLELTAYPINNERGKVIFIIEYVKDITKRVKTEQELKKSEERYRTLYQNTPIGISITDFDGNVLAMNDRMKIITGFESIDEFNRVKVSSTYKNPLERENMLKELKYRFNGNRR
ncbi:MAG: PAS domain S-box protein [Candidatus Lokiarchaeota archaeon]